MRPSKNPINPPQTAPMAASPEGTEYRSMIKVHLLPGRGVRHHPGGKPKPEFSRDLEETRRWLMRDYCQTETPPVFRVCLGLNSPLGPRGIFAVLKESPEKLHKLVLALAAFIQEGGYIHLVRVGAVTGPAHVTARLFMLDK
jgi:hypothetical protein